MIDLEDLISYLYKRGLSRSEIMLLSAFLINFRKGIDVKTALEIAEGALRDVESVEGYGGPYKPEPLGVKAGEAGLGSRGMGDFIVHEVLLDGKGGEDASAVGDVVVTVDGFHSRLSSVPLLMGFHATRAAIRDVMVSGALPLATLIDIHVADDTDLSYVFDVTAGASVAGEVAGAPLVGGSTLRIGGDMVIGSRVTGGSFAVGKRVRNWSRFNAKPGHVLCATQGKGGGSVTAFALTHKRYDLIDMTINMDFVEDIKRAFDMESVVGAFDWTNGGILLDAYEISKELKVRVILNENVYNAIHPRLLTALEEEGLDPLKFSVDSIVFIASKCNIPNTVEVGNIEEGEGVWLGSKKLEPSFREAPYTHVKKMVEPVKRPLTLDKGLEYIRSRKELLLKRLRDNESSVYGRSMEDIEGETR